jgi:DNA-binding Lrp family transcriptional regulator
VISKGVASTSKEAYIELNESGVGDTQREKILYVVNSYFRIHNEGMTNREIADMTNYEINAVSGRVNDLKKDGMLEVDVKRKCAVTGKNVNTVIPMNVMLQESFNKMRLLLGIYKYKRVKIVKDEYGDWILTISRHQQLEEEHYISLQVNTGLRLIQNRWEDSCTGYCYNYTIQKVRGEI